MINSVPMEGCLEPPSVQPSRVVIHHILGREKFDADVNCRRSPCPHIADNSIRICAHHLNQHLYSNEYRHESPENLSSSNSPAVRCIFRTCSLILSALPVE